MVLPLALLFNVLRPFTNVKCVRFADPWTTTHRVRKTACSTARCLDRFPGYASDGLLVFLHVHAVSYILSAVSLRLVSRLSASDAHLSRSSTPQYLSTIGGVQTNRLSRSTCKYCLFPWISQLSRDRQAKFVSGAVAHPNLIRCPMHLFFCHADLNNK